MSDRPPEAPYQIFETADRPICIAAGNDRLFVKLARATGHPEWCYNPLLSDGRRRAASRQTVVRCHATGAADPHSPGLDGHIVVGLPITFDRQRPYPQGGAPKLGEHNDEVFTT